MCVPSVLRHSRPPYDIVVVDLASLDGTTDYLAGIAAAARVPVKVTRIERDMDFAAAYNAGIAQCHGGLVVLLSNDTIVTEGWLDQLAALADLDPLIGMVGAMSNYAPQPQCTGPVPYGVVQRERESPSGDAAHVETEAIDRFARQWREDHKGQWFEAEQLAGFCLMIRRAALDAVARVRDARPATVLGRGVIPPDATWRLPARLLPGPLHPPFRQPKRRQPSAGKRRRKNRRLVSRRNSRSSREPIPVIDPCRKSPTSSCLARPPYPRTGSFHVPPATP